MHDTFRSLVTCIISIQLSHFPKNYFLCFRTQTQQQGHITRQLLTTMKTADYTTKNILRDSHFILHRGKGKLHSITCHVGTE